MIPSHLFHSPWGESHDRIHLSPFETNRMNSVPPHWPWLIPVFILHSSMDSSVTASDSSDQHHRLISNLIQVVMYVISYLGSCRCSSTALSHGRRVILHIQVTDLQVADNANVQGLDYKRNSVRSSHDDWSVLIGRYDINRYQVTCSLSARSSGKRSKHKSTWLSQVNTLVTIRHIQTPTTFYL